MPEAPTLDLTYSQMPALSERLTPLQRTLAESYQRVFMRGNRTDDLLIFSGLINEIADSQDAKRPALGYVEATKLTEQVGALQASEDELTGKLKDVRELLESLEFDQDKSRAILKEALGEDANIDTRPVYESIVQLFRKSQLEASTADDSSLQDELTLLKDQLAEATKVVEESQHAKQEKYAALHFEFRPKLEQFFGSQAQTQSIEDCFRNLIARHKHSETDISKAREHLISVLGEEQVDAVPMADGVLMLKARYSGACARIKQLEAQVGQLQASPVPQAPVISLQSPSALDTPSAADASNQPCKLLPVETPEVVAPAPIAPKAVVHLADSPRQAQDKRNPFLRVDGIYQFQSNNPNVGWIALPNFDIPRPVLKSMLLMAVGEANTWQEICKTLSLNCDVARDVQRGFALLINKLRTKAAGAPEVDEAIDKKPVAQMLEAVS